MSGFGPSSAPPHEIIVIPPPGHEDRSLLLNQCISVRTDVFVHEQQFSSDLEVDEHDATATHLLLRLVPSLIPIGTIRVYRPDGANYYKLSRLAILKPHRRYRFGGGLVLALHQWVKDDAKRFGVLQVTQVICHSQLPVKGFYAKYGYQPEGDEFDEDGAPHQRMIAYLSL